MSAGEKKGMEKKTLFSGVRTRKKRGVDAFVEKEIVHILDGHAIFHSNSCREKGGRSRPTSSTRTAARKKNPCSWQTRCRFVRPERGSCARRATASRKREEKRGKEGARWIFARITMGRRKVTNLVRVHEHERKRGKEERRGKAHIPAFYRNLEEKRGAGISAVPGRRKKGKKKRESLAVERTILHHRKKNRLRLDLADLRRKKKRKRKGKISLLSLPHARGGGEEQEKRGGGEPDFSMVGGTRRLGFFFLEVWILSKVNDSRRRFACLLYSARKKGGGRHLELNVAIQSVGEKSQGKGGVLKTVTKGRFFYFL